MFAVMIQKTFSIFSIVLLSLGLSAQLPEGFGLEAIFESQDVIMGLDFANDSTFFYWTKRGQVFVSINDEVISEPILDISEECAEWGDHGILGFTLDPNFNVNGRIYLLYVVENNWLFNHDSPDYDPLQTIPYQAAIGRITRYSVDLESMMGIVPDSRKVLLGDSIHNGIVQCSTSHSLGTLLFGSDGTLLASTGDASTWTEPFGGGPPYPELAFEQSALDSGMMIMEADIGAFRAQSIHSPNGKILRINPETGEGISSNPFYDMENPSSVASKVWALGLRNPFRMTLKPNTGSTDPLQGNPGVLFIGDVGLASYEEIDVCDGPAQNFGWPVYEGFDRSWHFIPIDEVQDPYSPNPLFSNSDCTIENYLFTDLIIQPNIQNPPSWTNSCEPIVLIPDSQIKFVHEPPAVAYSNGWSGQYHVYTGDFDDETGQLNWGEIAENDDIEILGEANFQGFASLGGDFYFGSRFPTDYFGAFFHVDYQGWCRVWWFNEGNELNKVSFFTDTLGLVNFSKYNPYDESMYFTVIEPSPKILRLTYDQNLKPIPEAEADIYYGTSPLTVQFSGANSIDPDDDPLSFHWDFGDGSTSQNISPSHTFIAPDNSPVSFEVELMVSDTAGNSAIQNLLISLNNTPPEVLISSIEDSTLYDLDFDGEQFLEADVSDNEHGPNELSYRWTTYLHHNSHYHEEEIITSPTGYTYISPIGCGIEGIFYYRVSLEVTDAAGLIGYDEKYLFPNCDTTDNESPIFPQFFIYPNPGSERLIIQGPFQNDVLYTIRIFNQQGRLVIEELKNVENFDRVIVALNTLNPGSYFLQMSSPSEITSFKLIVDR